MNRPITPRHVLRFAISVLIVLAIFALATRSGASTTQPSPQPNYTPVDYWVQTWEADFTHSPLTPAMLDEWREIHALLPNWIPAPPEPEYQIARVYSPQVEQWRVLVETYFQSRDVPWAMRVMNCESGGDQYAKNPISTASGAFQFLRSTWDWVAPQLGYGTHASGAVFDIEANIHAASWLFYNEGSQHWVCR